MEHDKKSDFIVSRDRKSRFKGSSINLFYLPAILLLIVFLVYPLISGFGLSLTNWDGYTSSKSFVGISNYVTMTNDVNFRKVLINTLIYGVGSTAIQQILGIALALMLNAKLHGRTLMRAVIYLPALVAPVIMGTMYYFIFQYQQGALNAVRAWIGLSRIAWFNNSTAGVVIIVLVNSVQFVGVSMIIYLAGLQTMDQQVLEAADIDGAYGWKKFWNVTLPMLMPSFITSVVLNLIGGLKLYDAITVLTGGGPGYSTDSMSTYIGKMFFNNQSAGYASAIGVVLFVLIGVATYLLNIGLSKLNWEA